MVEENLKLITVICYDFCYLYMSAYLSKDIYDLCLIMWICVYIFLVNTQYSRVVYVICYKIVQ